MSAKSGYFLRLHLKRGTKEVGIAAETFAEIREARNLLLEVLFVEEKFEILLSNYLALERISVCAAAETMVRDRFEHDDFFELRMSLNVAMVNLLSSARLYVDQLAGHVARCLPKVEDVRDRVKGLFCDEYDENFEYRFMEALRNYSQHSNIPVHAFSVGGGWVEIDGEELLEHRIQFWAKREKLSMDRAFKAAVSAEMPEAVDLLKAVRCYMECLSRVHATVRRMIADVARHSRAVLQSAIDKLDDSADESISQRLATNRSEAAVIIEEFAIDLDWDDIRLRLERRNGYISNLRRSYPSGRVPSRR